MNLASFARWQTIVLAKMRKLTKEGLSCTDKRVGLMNEILSAMDIVKYIYWSYSYKASNY